MSKRQEQAALMREQRAAKKRRGERRSVQGVVARLQLATSAGDIVPTATLELATVNGNKSRGKFKRFLGCPPYAPYLESTIFQPPVTLHQQGLSLIFFRHCSN